MFNGLDTTYSLVNVVAEHIKMLLDAGIPLKLLVSEHCPDAARKGIYADERIEWVKVANAIDGTPFIWHDYPDSRGNLHPTFFDEASVIAADLAEKLSDADVCFLHDILYQGRHLVHNVALRKALVKLPGIRFVAVTHSTPFPPAPGAKWPFSARYTPMPGTIYTYPTKSGIHALAAQYGVCEDKCRVLGNSLNPLAGMSEEVNEIASRADLFASDVLAIYPGRLSIAKKMEKVAAFAGVLIKTGLTVKVVFCDFPSPEIRPSEYKAIIKAVGERYGTHEENLIFTSDLGFDGGISRNAVLDLFTLSNLFICPSFSESFGLTVIEAASRGNFIILNEAVPALKELGNQLKAYFMRWDARNFSRFTQERYYPSEEAYLEEHAGRVVQLMKADPVIHAKTLVRQRYNPDWVWKNQLEPLLNEIGHFMP